MARSYQQVLREQVDDIERRVWRARMEVAQKQQELAVLEENLKLAKAQYYREPTVRFRVTEGPGASHQWFTPLYLP